MRFSVVAILLIALFANRLFAQETQKGTGWIGSELQVYPAGIIPGFQFEYYFSEHHSGHVRLGANIANRRDWGKHDDERGEGFGGTIGYRYRGHWRGSTFSAGLRTDIWDMQIRWQNTTITMGQQSTNKGETSILVIQPTLEVGWWKVLSERWTMGICISNGYEINVKTKGDPVGEGAITLLGINLFRSI